MRRYLLRSGINRHVGAHNLKSSWVSGVNLYFPFDKSPHGRSLFAGFLSTYVDPRIRTVESVELEYAECDALSPADLLGETGGRRGSGQTSPDIAVLVNGGAGLLLIENKLTERSFYSCSARTDVGSAGRPANPDARRCNRAAEIAVNALPLCHQQVWGRKYWEHLQAVVNQHRVSVLKCCPAAKSGYQLFRQQALAEGIAKSSKYEFVATCVALDHRNDVLAGCLKSTGLADIREWGDLFAGRSKFRVFSHQDWMAWVRGHDADRWQDWLDWMQQRYRF